jgi:hypothetical protein
MNGLIMPAINHRSDLEHISSTGIVGYQQWQVCREDSLISCWFVVQVQVLMTGIICGFIPVLLLLGVLTRFVCNAQQGKLLW